MWVCIPHAVVCTHNGVLVEVVVGAAGNGVELHEVVKVGDLSSDPFVSEPRLLEETSWPLDANTIEVRGSQGNNLVIHFTHHL